MSAGDYAPETMELPNECVPFPAQPRLRKDPWRSRHGSLAKAMKLRSALRSLAHVPCPRACAGMCADGFRAFTFGGFDGQSDRSDLWGCRSSRALRRGGGGGACGGGGGGGGERRRFAADQPRLRRRSDGRLRKRQQRMMAELWKAHSYEHNVHIPLHIRVWQAQFGEEAAEAGGPPAAAARREEPPPPRRRCESDRISLISIHAPLSLICACPPQSPFACSSAAASTSFWRPAAPRAPPHEPRPPPPASSTPLAGVRHPGRRRPTWSRPSAIAGPSAASSITQFSGLTTMPMPRSPLRTGTVSS